jgi:hypothetical protein
LEQIIDITKHWLVFRQCFLLVIEGGNYNIQGSYDPMQGGLKGGYPLKLTTDEVSYVDDELRDIEASKKAELCR